MARGPRWGGTCGPTATTPPPAPTCSDPHTWRHAAVPPAIQPPPALASGMDPWGWAIGHHFAIAETLYRAGEWIPATWEYRPGMGVEQGEAPDESDDWSAALLYEMFDDDEIDGDDLRHAGNVLARYCRLCVAQGLDY